MISIEDLRIGDDAYVISEKKTGVIVEIKKKKNSPTYLITVEYDNGEEFTTSLDNIDEPRYHVTPLGIMWCALCDVLGDDFIGRDDSNKLAEEILNKFMNGMIEGGMIKKEEED
jgi:hypothetical protein